MGFQQQPNSRGSDLKWITLQFGTLPIFLLKPKIGSKVLCRKKRKFDANKISRDLSSQDWMKLYQCEGGISMYKIIIKILVQLLFTPLIKSSQPERKVAEKPWLTKELREEMTEKHRLFNIWKLS